MATRAVFLGPPGAGKGTQASKLASSRQAAHIATGELFRASVAEGNELGRKVKEYLSAGKLVPDDLVIELVDWRLRRPDAERAFVLDGFPRTVNQAQTLDRLLADRGLSLASVVLFEITDAVLVERASGRLICRGCGTPYNAASAPPKSPGICDKCGQPLYRRDDDRPDVVSERLRVYRQQTEPLIEFYTNKTILHKLNADRPIDVVSRELDRMFQKNSGTASGAVSPQKDGNETQLPRTDA
ncbi:MAG: adenylate kinase [Planctomycetes bacterium]|nr:adenylate kinase [Planctomycetota bacterium]